jgi:putative transposase
MYKKREFVDGAFYHVTSRTNDKIRVFENKLGRKIMLITLQAAKDKYRFTLTNFCVMPTHIHLLIKPPIKPNLSVIMQWIKLHSALYWNKVHGSTDHLWEQRFFARVIRNDEEYNFVMDYIDQNAVIVGLADKPENWKASGAYYKTLHIQQLVDYEHKELEIKLLSPIPPIVSRLLPQAQLSQAIQYYGAYAETIDRLYKTVQDIPRIGETETENTSMINLHYTTNTADYFIYEYDGQDTMYGKVCRNVYPKETIHKRINLTTLKTNPTVKLDFSWRV